MILLLTTGCVIDMYAQSQTIEVTGMVRDAEKIPLAGVNISVKNVAGLGVITNIDGEYKIKIAPYSTLIFSYIGFETQEVLIKDNMSKVDVTLRESSASVIDEVVITGTGAQKKITMTGAVSTVDVDVLKSSPTSSLVNALAGNVPGVLARQTSGRPGANMSEFWIRGISTFGAGSGALVLVDGFERSLNEVNVEDIESFSVLKDASATAIYGSRGANGVVLITTKRGKAGKININAKVETSYNTRTMTPDFVDGYTYATMLNESRTTRSQQPMYSQDEPYVVQAHPRHWATDHNHERQEHDRRGNCWANRCDHRGANAVGHLLFRDLQLFCFGASQAEIQDALDQNDDNHDAAYNPKSQVGGGHGDFHMIVLAPNSVQEMHDHVAAAFAGLEIVALRRLDRTQPRAATLAVDHHLYFSHYHQTMNL